MKLETHFLQARLRAPFVTAQGTIDVRPLVCVRVLAADGHVGYGEAAPLGHYDGVSVGDLRGALEDCRPLLEQDDGADRAELLATCARAAVLPQAVAAIDLALWDLAGRRAGAPVWRLLGAARADPVDVNYAIAAGDRAGAAREAAGARAARFRCLKVKVGIGDDDGRLAAVRAAAGAGMLIRLDANGTWSLPEAQAALRALEPVGIELCEEPVASLGELEALAATTTLPLAIDESTATPGALDGRLCRAVCLKISRSGGISGLLEAALRARHAGYEVYLASTLDGPLGIAAALHAAAILRPERPCGLATLQLFDAREDPLPPIDGRIAVPTGPGLGDGLLDWYGVSWR